jgi:hypothetical protein
LSNAQGRSKRVSYRSEGLRQKWGRRGNPQLRQWACLFQSVHTVLLICFAQPNAEGNRHCAGPGAGIPPIAHQGEPPITDLLQHTSITKESVKEGKDASFTLTLTCGRPTDSTTGIPGKESVGDDLSSHGPGDSRQLAANFLRATSRLRVLLLALDSFHIFNGQAGSPCGGGLGVNLEQHAHIVS